MKRDGLNSSCLHKVVGARHFWERPSSWTVNIKRFGVFRRDVFGAVRLRRVVQTNDRSNSGGVQCQWKLAHPIIKWAPIKYGAAGRRAQEDWSSRAQEDWSLSVTFTGEELEFFKDCGDFRGAEILRRMSESETTNGEAKEMLEPGTAGGADGVPESETNGGNRIRGLRGEFSLLDYKDLCDMMCCRAIGKVFAKKCKIESSLGVEWMKGILEWEDLRNFVFAFERERNVVVSGQDELGGGGES